MEHEALVGLPLFDGMTDDEVKACAEHFEIHRVLPGDRLTEKDDFGYSFFVVLEGSVRVSNGDQFLAELGPGDYFGEMALVKADRRNATVTALKGGRLAKMMIWDFRELVEKNAKLANRIQDIVDQRKGD